MSDSVRPHRRQPIRLCRPWDSPGKNTGVGCHFLLQCIKVKSKSEVTQLCLTFRDPMDYSLPGSSVHGIFQARVLEWGAIALSAYSLRRLQFDLISSWHDNFLTKDLCIIFISRNQSQTVVSHIWKPVIKTLLTTVPLTPLLKCELEKIKFIH